MQTENSDKPINEERNKTSERVRKRVSQTEADRTCDR